MSPLGNISLSAEFGMYVASSSSSFGQFTGSASSGGS